MVETLGGVEIDDVMSMSIERLADVAHQRGLPGAGRSKDSAVEEAAPDRFLEALLGEDVVAVGKGRARGRDVVGGFGGGLHFEAFHSFLLLLVASTRRKSASR